jgi:hypothetical protein
MLNEVSGYFIGLKSIGGIRVVIRDWDDGKRRDYRDFLRETGDRFHGVAAEIEEAL